MTVCKNCGADLSGVQIKARRSKDSLIGFLRGWPAPGDPMAKAGTPEYTEKHGYLDCPGCPREIPISPKMANNPEEYDKL